MPCAAIDVDDFAARSCRRIPASRRRAASVPRSVRRPARRSCRDPARPRPSARPLRRTSASRRRLRRAPPGSGRLLRLRPPAATWASRPAAALSRRRADLPFPSAAPALSSSVSTTWPTLIRSPCLTRTSLTVPATLDGTSIVALSVSSSRIGLVLGDGVADGDQHPDDVTGGDVLAELRKREICWHVVVCLSRGGPSFSPGSASPG